MKKYIFLFLFLSAANTHAQTRAERDSLTKILKTLPNDTNRVKILNHLASQFYLTKPDTSYILGQQANELAHNIHYLKGEAMSLNTIGAILGVLGDYAKSLKAFSQAKELYAKQNNKEGVARILSDIASTYMYQGEWQKGLANMLESYAIIKTIYKPNAGINAIPLSNIAQCYYNLNQLDSATIYLNQALPLAQSEKSGVLSEIFFTLGDVAFAKNNIAQAKSYYHQSITFSLQNDNYTYLYEAYSRLSKLYQRTQQKDSTLNYAKLALTFAQKAPYLQGILKSSQFLSTLYKGKNDTEALHYYEISVAARDSLFSQKKVKESLSMAFEEKEQEARNQRRIEAHRIDFENKIKYYILLGVLLGLGIFAFVLYRNNKQKHKANVILQEQKEEIQTTLSKLKATQNQLIQSEKLASLGELTAGIAHEIQNPLNFVNNFSELSVGLIQEIQEEREKPKEERDEELENELLTDLSANQEKINHHGKRASSIVTGMLQHSQASAGVKELTDINKLADESLRLSFQALRAKNKSFNAKIETNFDENLPKIEVISQDLGRVLINLCNNAFYACTESSGWRSSRSAVASATLSHRENFEPKVIVITRRLSEAEVEISVKDNGTGMSEATKAKIFQPFFTTKPTGQGTGLGLSISYDIITKGHGGTLEVDTKEGEGTTFNIKIPI